MTANIVTRAEIEAWKRNVDEIAHIIPQGEIFCRLIASYERAMDELDRCHNACCGSTAMLRRQAALLAAYDGAGGEAR